MLRGFGCAWAQGHLFAPPMPPDELAAWLASWERRDRPAPERALPPALAGPGAGLSQPLPHAVRPVCGRPRRAQLRGWYWSFWYSGICSSWSAVSPDIR